MSKSYGQMMGYLNAIIWVEENAPDEPEKEQVLARMRYEADRTMPVQPRFHKGINGRKYDSWACGNCGRGNMDVGWKYCPNCGFRVVWG